jgi:phage gp45-like
MGLTVLYFIGSAPLFAQEGYWKISQLSISNVYEPVINNNGEIVWYLNSGGGIFSSVRGKLSDSGIFPHLANSGEVVYADWLGGLGWDLVSTTQGRLTYGGIIDVNASGFDVNAKGEVVYVVPDINENNQIYSTIRGQVTFDAADHVNPCINDSGEIAWNQYTNGGSAVFSSTRGVFPGNYPWLLDLNNAGEFCFSGYLEGPPGNYSYPHLFSSAHGVVINDTNQFQWGGSLNDAGVFVWYAPEIPGGSTWYVYQAVWVKLDTTPPQIKRLLAGPNVLWPPNGRMISVKLNARAIDNIDPAPSIRITQVLCNEPQTHSTPDWVITGPLSVTLRAVRDATHAGRVYTIVVLCSDKSGNTSTASVKVVVPRRYLRGRFY